jgi:macrodomain Ter protein organizer (MatP/YcbG family)
MNKDLKKCRKSGKNVDYLSKQWIGNTVRNSKTNDSGSFHQFSKRRKRDSQYRHRISGTKKDLKEYLDNGEKYLDMPNVPVGGEMSC